MATKNNFKEGESGWSDANRVNRRIKPTNSSNIAKTAYDLQKVDDKALLKAMIIGEMLATPRCKSRFGGRK
ncbi:MAG: hypothetical protein R3Y23_04210 [Bacillota bacterium]